MNTKKDFKVVIAGAGPAGLLLARELAKANISVSVYDKKDKDSYSHTWSDEVEVLPLKEAGFEIPTLENGILKGCLVKKEEIDNNLFESHLINPLQIWSPDMTCKTKADVNFKSITTDRIALEKMLLKQAVDAGAEIFYNHAAVKLIGDTNKDLEDINIQGLTVKNLNTDKLFNIMADIVVDATGCISSLRTSLSHSNSIGNSYKNGDLAFAYRTVRKIDTTKLSSDNLFDYYRYGAYKGYFWMHEHSSDIIDIGGGVKKEPNMVDTKKIVDEMISTHPSITDEEIRGRKGLVLVGKSPYSIAASGFIAVGDAAGQVIPTTGCGVGSGIIGALLASKTIIDCFQSGSTSIESLWSYNWRWFVESQRGANLAALEALKEILQDLPQDDITFLIKHDVLSGEMLTPSINGTLCTPGVWTSIKTLFKGISKLSLLMKLNNATKISKKIYDHYMEYPKTWDKDKFYAWKHRSEEYFNNLN